MSQQELDMETTVGKVHFEHLQETLGVGTARPRLSWMVSTQINGWVQEAYEIEGYSADGKLTDQTGKVISSEAVLVDWPFAPLKSRERKSVRVRVWGENRPASAWSDLAPVEAGLLEPGDWTARFIIPGWEEDTTQPQPGPLLRREFHLKAGIKQARLYITAHGIYEAQLNGKPVGDHVMAPGWTSYHHRLRYQIFDVTGLLQPGQNAIGAMLGDGWFRGRLGFGGGQPNIYGDRIALLAQLEIEYADGTKEQIVTDEHWKAVKGPVLLNDIYNGETYDAQLELPGWAETGYDDSSWAGVTPVEWDMTTLFAPLGPPVRRTQIVKPVSITQSPSGKTLVDFGQNLVGRLRITVQGPAGQVITLRHAEVLENGELGTRPLRHAKATDQYILRGGGVETWEPRFTFHGFRYAEISGWPGELKLDDLVAVVCHSDMERTGWFECSDPLLTQLHANVVWGMRGNFLDIPTDCPQRDERLGWTGDIQVFSPTASFLYNSAGFLSSWLADVAAEQKQYGVVPNVVPNTLPGVNPPAAAWGDAAAVVPWVLYQRFGDSKILEVQFESMRAWVDLLDNIAGEKHLWDTGFQFGDWLDPAAPPDKPGAARTPGFIVATAYLARSAELVGLAAGVLGLKKEEMHYQTLAAEVRKAFNQEYVTPGGRVIGDASTAYALALEFALLEDETQRSRAAARLANLVRANGYRISTGFVGTPLICDALCHRGYYQAAYRLLTQRECPSWLYPVTMGATTIWERWDSMLPDGSINPGEMTSFNHYALGAVADWMHRTIAGLAPAQPGYRQLEIRPVPGGGLTRASARHITPYGPAQSAWKIEGGTLTLEVEVPPNTTATVFLPGSDASPVVVGSGKYSWAVPYQEIKVERPTLTVDSPIGDLVDDEEAFNLVINTVKDYGLSLADRLVAQDQVSIHRALNFMPQGKKMLEIISEALAKLQEK